MGVKCKISGNLWGQLVQCAKEELPVPGFLPPFCHLSVQAGTPTLHWTNHVAAVTLMHFDPPDSLHCTALHCSLLSCIPSHSIAPPRHQSCTTCCPQILVEPGPKFPAMIWRISPRFTQQNVGSSCILIFRDWAALFDNKTFQSVLLDGGFDQSVTVWLNMTWPKWPLNHLWLFNNPFSQEEKTGYRVHTGYRVKSRLQD